MFMHLLRVFFFGLKECLNPYSVALLLFFYVYLTIVGRTYKKLFFEGLLFLFIIEMVYAHISSGALDMYILRKDWQQYFHFFFLGVSAGYIIFAGMNFFDWFNLRVRERLSFSPIVAFPAFCRFASREEEKRSFVKVFGQGVTIIVFQFLASVFIAAQVIWPFSIDVYRLYVIFLGDGYLKYGRIFYGAYALGETFLMIVLWVALLFFFRKNQKQDLILTLNQKTLYKIIVSSIYCALGLGMIYHFFQ